MCGRFSIATPWEELHDRFGALPPTGDFHPRYNAAPGQELPVIAEETPDQISFFQWGLVPFWAKDPKIGRRLINARAETILEKLSFREAFKKHRCLVLSDGFYEWDKVGRSKDPYRIALKNNQPFAFAGICDYWKDQAGNILKTFSIITTQANGLVSRIHDRMPVILPPAVEKAWLDPQVKNQALAKFLQPYPEKKMAMYQISKRVNSPKNDFPEILKPV